MTAEERRHALMVVLGAQLEMEAAAQQIKRSNIAYGRVSFPTVAKVLKGQNCKVSSLVTIADALDCDVTITLHKRTA